MLPDNFIIAIMSHHLYYSIIIEHNFEIAIGF